MRFCRYGTLGGAPAIEPQPVAQRNFYSANYPVVLSGLMNDWSAITAWSPDYLKRVVGNAEVELTELPHIGEDQRSPFHRTRRILLPFFDYLDRVYSDATPCRYAIDAQNHFFRLAEARPLLSDIKTFPEYLCPINGADQCFLLLSPFGATKLLHHELCNTLLAQVSGRKHYRLVPPTELQYVYNTTGAQSDVDCKEPDFGRHPLFRRARVIDVVVEAGETLFLPVGWWCHTLTLGISITIALTNFIYPNHYEWE
jgi:Cupin-like domain